MIAHLMWDRRILKALRTVGLVLAILGLGIGILFANYALMLLGAWSGFCAFNTHRYLVGGEMAAPGLHEDAASDADKVTRLYVLLLWWLPLLVVLVLLAYSWLQG